MGRYDDTLLGVRRDVNSRLDVHPRDIRNRGVQAGMVRSSCEHVCELLSAAAGEQMIDMIAREESTNTMIHLLCIVPVTRDCVS